MRWGQLGVTPPSDPVGIAAVLTRHNAYAGGLHGTGHQDKAVGNPVRTRYCIVATQKKSGSPQRTQRGIAATQKAHHESTKTGKHKRAGLHRGHREHREEPHGKK